jgi:hypothetical protein
MTRITLREFEPRLESHWGDSSRKNGETWITLRGFKSEEKYDFNHVEKVEVGKKTETWATLRGFKSE